ncbi:hypothetical protein KI387_001307, partial [Taxus chinensis]
MKGNLKPQEIYFSPCFQHQLHNTSITGINSHLPNETGILDNSSVFICKTGPTAQNNKYLLALPSPSINNHSVGKLEGGVYNREGARMHTLPMVGQILDILTGSRGAFSLLASESAFSRHESCYINLSIRSLNMSNSKSKIHTTSLKLFVGTRAGFIGRIKIIMEVGIVEVNITPILFANNSCLKKNSILNVREGLRWISGMVDIHLVSSFTPSPAFSEHEQQWRINQITWMKPTS